MDLGYNSISLQENIETKIKKTLIIAFFLKIFNLKIFIEQIIIISI